MKSKHRPIGMLIAFMVVFATGTVLAVDKYAARVPEGLALSEFKGYETWEVVSASHVGAGGEGMGDGETFNIVVANPVMIEAYAAGIPSNGKPFPDGAKTVKIQYSTKKSSEAPVRCGAACHTIVKSKDYVFTRYEKK